MKRIAPISILVAGLLLCVQAVAQNEYEVSFGNYTVNYNTFPSTFIEPAISKAVGIKRSDNHGVITIAVRQRTTGSDIKAVKATVSGMASNLVGQLRKLKFTEVKDGAVLYYIGDFPVVSNEQLTFTITLLPEGEAQPHEFKFTRQF